LIIKAIVADSSEDVFLSDKILQRAAVMALLNIGEMAAHLDSEFRSTYAAIPWKKIIGLRNLAAHGYFVLDMTDIWQTITNDVPVLEDKVSKILLEPHP
jgi:uncharacterized protein with HEPN domain